MRSHFDFQRKKRIYRITYRLLHMFHIISQYSFEATLLWIIWIIKINHIKVPLQCHYLKITPCKEFVRFLKKLFCFSEHLRKKCSFHSIIYLFFLTLFNVKVNVFLCFREAESIKDKLEHLVSCIQNTNTHSYISGGWYQHPLWKLCSWGRIPNTNIQVGINRTHA